MTLSHETSLSRVSAGRVDRDRDRARLRTRTIPHPLWGWVALLGAPLAWAVHLGARYPMVAVACEARSIWPLQAITLGCLIAGALSLAVAIRLSRGIEQARLGRGERSDEEELAPRAPDERSRSRLAFLGRAGVLTSIVFLATIVAEGVTPFFLDPCAEALLP